MKLVLISAFALSLALPAIAQDATAELNKQVLEAMQSTVPAQAAAEQEAPADVVMSPVISSNEQKHIHVIEIKKLTDDRIPLEIPGAITGHSKETGDIHFTAGDAGETCKHHAVKYIKPHAAEPQSLLDHADMAGDDSIAVKAYIIKQDDALDSLSLSLSADVLVEQTLEDGTRRFIAHTAGDPSQGVIIDLREFSEKQ